jgi:hypothetical protein
MPLVLMLPPPYSIITFALAGISTAIFAINPLPKWILVGFLNSKFNIVFFINNNAKYCKLFFNIDFTFLQNSRI